MTATTGRYENVVPLPAVDASAEHIALSTALASREDLDTLRTQLLPDDFTSEPARLTYIAMLTVADRDGAVTKTTLLDELYRHNHAGAITYLSRLDAGAPGGAHHYVQLILTAARSRQLLAAAQRLQQLAALDPGDPVEAEERDARALDITLGLAQDLETTDRVLPDLAALRHERVVRAEADKIRAREDARRLVIREQRGIVGMPALITGAQFLAQPDDPISYRIDKLWPTGGRVLLAAQYKAGKTTMMGNLIRSLVDADPFLGHNVTRQARRVVLLDNELSEGMLRVWLRGQHIRRTDAFAPVSLKGRITSFDILDPITRREWAEHLAEAQPDVLILDCLRPILDAFGLDENRDAGKFLTAFDEMLGLAGIPDAIVVHHMGHQGERSRGDSRLRDWPDVEWRLTRETEDPSSPRFFTAFGRDVDVPETALTYDTTTRRLDSGQGDRRDAAAYRALPDLLDLIAEADPTGEGISQRQIIARALAAGVASKALVPKILSAAINQKQLNNWTGPRAAQMYSLKINPTVHSSTAPEISGAVVTPPPTSDDTLFMSTKDDQPPQK